MAQRDAPESPPHRVLALLREHAVRPLDVEPLPGDVSLRRYFRLRFEQGHTAVLATYPPELRESCARFARTSSLLSEAGVRVPGIQLALCRSGLMVVEDLGDQTLYDLRGLAWDELLPFLRRAVEVIGAIHSIPRSAIPESSPPLDRELLSAELDRTWDLLTGEEGIVPDSLPPALESAFGEMISLLAESPSLPCHRDFMARNLVPVGDRADLAVIDHQDLRLGPATYDLASLLNDSLYPPPEIEAELLEDGLGSPDERPAYHRAASQRTLKAVGTFVAFARRGHERHRVLVSPTLERARYHLRNLPEMRPVEGEIDALWRALLEQGSAT